MESAKWIGGALGFITLGPLGALAGFALGSMLDNATKETVTDTPSSRAEGQRNSFMFSLLVLASYIIKADGKVMHSEMEFVRKFLRVNFGNAAVEQGEEILLNLFAQRKKMDAQNPHAFKETIRQCCRQISGSMSPAECLQLMNFLAMIAKSDGHVCQAEIDALREVGDYMYLSRAEVDSLLNLGGNTLEAAYKVLEVSPDATDAEVKASYRRLVLKHHPDKVAALGEDVRRAAEEKMQAINEAKETVFKARGL